MKLSASPLASVKAKNGSESEEIFILYQHYLLCKVIRPETAKLGVRFLLKEPAHNSKKVQFSLFDSSSPDEANKSI